MWALGCIIYEMLTGEVLLQKYSFNQILKREVSFSEIKNKEAVTFIKKCLTVNFNNRLGSYDCKNFKEEAFKQKFMTMNGFNPETVKDQVPPLPDYE